MSFWVFWVCPGGLGLYPQGGLGPQAGRFQGPAAFWAGPRGDPANFSRKPAKTHIFGTFGGVGGTPQGGLGPQAGRIQGPGASCAGPRGRPRQSSRNKHFWQFWGSGGYFQGSGAAGWQIPGTRSLLGLSEGATPPSSQPPHRPASFLGGSEANLPCLLP